MNGRMQERVNILWITCGLWRVGGCGKYWYIFVGYMGIVWIYTSVS